MTRLEIAILTAVAVTALAASLYGIRRGRVLRDLQWRLGLSWTCHVCGRMRPDKRISVHSFQIRDAPPGFVRNVRYCNDRPECLAGAEAWGKTQK